MMLSAFLCCTNRLCYGIGICQCGLQGRADFSTWTMGERATGQHAGPGQHPHQVSFAYCLCWWHSAFVMTPEAFVETTCDVSNWILIQNTSDKVLSPHRAIEESVWQIVYICTSMQRQNWLCVISHYLLILTQFSLHSQTSVVYPTCSCSHLFLLWASFLLVQQTLYFHFILNVILLTVYLLLLAKWLDFFGFWYLDFWFKLLFSHEVVIFLKKTTKFKCSCTELVLNDWHKIILIYCILVLCATLTV